ncbi:MAG TPA: DUF2892 domain-containing protein [Chlorobiota bacterium]|nr:DUF2892 domain-containing protein [Chlorobiota bacterium]
MIRNIGPADRTVRLLLAVVGLVMLVTGSVSGVWFTVVTIVTALLVITALVRTCPVYIPLGLSTDKVTKES